MTGLGQDRQTPDDPRLNQSLCASTEPSTPALTETMGVTAQDASDTACTSTSQTNRREQKPRPSSHRVSPASVMGPLVTGLHQLLTLSPEADEVIEPADLLMADDGTERRIPVWGGAVVAAADVGIGAGMEVVTR